MQEQEPEVDIEKESKENEEIAKLEELALFKKLQTLGDLDVKRDVEEEIARWGGGIVPTKEVLGKRVWGYVATFTIQRDNQGEAFRIIDTLEEEMRLLGYNNFDVSRIRGRSHDVTGRYLTAPAYVNFPAMVIIKLWGKEERNERARELSKPR